MLMVEYKIIEEQIPVSGYCRDLPHIHSLMNLSQYLLAHRTHHTHHIINVLYK
jgi:hypothetical protein